MRVLLTVRRKISTWISRRLIKKPFSIISDDCWGGQIYRQLCLPYLTPTVGLWIDPKNYLSYIEGFEKKHVSKLSFRKNEMPYPVAMLCDVRINFMHFKNEKEALEKYWSRYSRIDSNRLFYKIDFGKPGYSKSDMEKWNMLRLNNSIAFYPPTIELPNDGIHNGVKVEDWQINGAAMFDITRKYFNIFAWLRDGSIKTSLLYRVVNVLLFDPTVPRRIAKNFIGWGKS